MGGAFSFYARQTSGGWLLTPIPVMVDSLAIATRPYTLTVQEVTGDDIPELLVGHYFSGGSNVRDYVQIFSVNEKLMPEHTFLNKTRLFIKG